MTCAKTASGQQEQVHRCARCQSLCLHRSAHSATELVCSLDATVYLQYIGAWALGMYCGEGTYICADGTKYVGTWKNNCMHGKGVLTKKLANQPGAAEVYEGDFQNHKMWGQGQYRYANGDVYVGQWKNGMHHGQGMLSKSAGGYYRGEWQENQKHGQGEAKLPNGESYIGQWAQGHRHGKGTL